MLYDPRRQKTKYGLAAERAAAYLETYGWRKGALGRQGEPACILGAIRNTCNDLQIESYLINILELKTSQESIARWNDQHSSEDAIALLRSIK